MDTPSPADIESRRSPKGGWSRATITEWGIPWPPPPDWRAGLRRQWASEELGRLTQGASRTRCIRCTGQALIVLSIPVCMTCVDEYVDLVPGARGLSHRSIEKLYAGDAEALLVLIRWAKRTHDKHFYKQD